MTTFSQMVDELVLEHKRPDLRPQIASYLNQTIREVHFTASQRSGGVSVPVLFGENRTEAIFLIADTPAVWPIPSVTRFQRFETAFDPIRGQYIYERDLGKIVNNDRFKPNQDLFWYRSGPNICFSGSQEGTELAISYFMYPRRLTYYLRVPTDQRPAYWDEEIEDFVYPDTVTTPEQELEARLLVSNWLLLRWADTLMEGVRAKIFKRLGEEVRARMTYSAFEAQREQIHQGETWNTGAM